MGVTLHTYTHGELNWDTKLVPLGGGDSDLERLANAINYAAAIDATDLNAITKSGNYIGNTLTNSPGGSGTYMLEANVFNATNQVQTAYDMTNRITYWRRQQSGAWTGWHPYLDDGNVQSTIGDTGWVTSSTGITAPTGWTVTASKYRIRNGLAMVGVSGTRTGAAVAAGANGAIANSIFANLPSLLVPSASNGIVINSGGSASFAAAGYVSQASSQLIWTTAPLGIPTSGVVDAYAEYYL